MKLIFGPPDDGHVRIEANNKPNMVISQSKI